MLVDVFENNEPKTNVDLLQHKIKFIGTLTWSLLWKRKTELETELGRINMAKKAELV